MRLLRLDLSAYGPFTDRSLDFSGDPRRLAIVLGSNEAGKSTSLRAVLGLLFGIEARTPDAHTHPYGELRVGGVLESASGEILDVVRRKGLKGTLRDRSGEPVDDARLRALLRGVDLDAFRALYGLDHETLRIGAEALEKAQGKVGESLFDAGLGGLGVGQAIAAFAEEADDLFTPQARKKPLNEAIRALVEARKLVRNESTSPEAVPEQERGILEAKLVAKEAEAERRASIVERQTLTRVGLVAPALAKRAALLDARRALGVVAMLPETATNDRQEASLDRAEALAKIARLGDEITFQRERLTAIVAPRALVDAGPAIERLKERAGVVAASTALRPRHAEELEIASRRRVEIVSRVGALAARAHDAGAAARISELAIERDAADLYARQAEARVVELALASRRADEELSRSPVVLGSARLEAALVDASSVADLPVRVAADEIDLAAIGARVASGLASLGLFRGDAADLVRLDVPPIELVSTAERSLREREARRSASREREVAAERAGRERARDLDMLLARGAPPSEEELSRARRTRDALVAALEADSIGPEGIDRIRSAIGEADAIADRLRREATQIEKRAQLEAAIAESAEIVVSARAEQLALDEEDAREALAWRAAWASSGLTPLGPSEMLSWLERRRVVVELELTRAELSQRVEASRARVALAIASLAEARRSLSGERDESPGRTSVDESPGRTSLDAALFDARAALAALERARVRREALVVAAGERRAQLEAARAEAETLALGREAARARFAEALAGLGLREDASLGEATARASDLAELARVEAEIARLAETLARIDADREELAHEVARLSAEHQVDLAELGAESDPLARATAIARRYGEAREGDVARREITAALATLEASLADEHGRLTRAEAKLAELTRVAGVEVDDLPAAEAKSREARRLDAEIEATERELRTHAGGASFAELEAERAACEGVDREARLEELDELIEASAARRDRAHHDLGGFEAGLTRLEKKGDAADLALTAEAHLARAATLLRRYAVLRLAKTVLEREVERYRATHQTPILKRAEALFARLTSGRYEALRVVVEGDTPELRCVRGGREIEIAGLSDGTRDQLFLALRLATLERHASFGEPMPLVLDDVFVHFDDERTRAGLEVLAELAGTVQVLLFTHHARVVELAERAPALPFVLRRL